MKPKRKKPFNAGAASLKQLESEGWHCWNVESQIPHTFIKRDCFRFADYLAMSPTRHGIMLVQVTGGKDIGNFNKRVAKVKAEPLAALWLASGGRIQVHSWETTKGQIGRTCRVLEITSEN